MGVRELLTEATRRVGDRSVGGRHAAVVLLDGAVEAAIAVCLGEFGDSPSDRDSLADMQNRLSRHTQKVKGLVGWRDANRLRRARNLAQHHQVPIDSETLETLHPPVATYVDSLIRSTLGIRMSDVVLSDAIHTEELRTLLEEVEAAIDDGDLAAAIAKLRRTFLDARGRWLPSSRLRHRDELGIGEMIDNATADMRDLVEATPFAPDPAEYLWYRRAMTSNESSTAIALTEDDVRRALQFVVGWIVRWEAYNRTHAQLTQREREARRVVTAPSTRTDGRPEWAEQPEVLLRHEGTDVTIGGAIRWGKAEDTDERSDDWLRAVGQAIRATFADTGHYARLDGDRLVISLGEDETASGTDDGAVAERTMHLANVAFARALDELQELDSERAATHEKLKDREAKARALLAAVRAATGDQSSPFASASGDTFESRNVLLYLTSDWSTIMRNEPSGSFAPTIGNFYRDSRGTAWSLPADAGYQTAADEAGKLGEQLTRAVERQHLLAEEAQHRRNEIERVIALRWNDPSPIDPQTSIADSPGI